MNYSNKLKQNLNQPLNYKVPSKKQAIVLDNIEDSEIEEYIYKIGEIVDPKHITHASKIANNRLCIYFDSIEIVDNIASKTNHIKLNNIKIPIRRLVSLSSRIIISGGQPCVSDSQVEEELKKLGMKLESPITPLRLGLKNDRFSHI